MRRQQALWWGKRLLVTALVAGVVLAGASLLGQERSQGPALTAELDAPEFGPDRVVAERLPASGEIRPELRVTNGSRTVLIDGTHGNPVDRATVAPLASAIGRTGYAVHVLRDGSIREALNESEALVIVDPAEPYEEAELDAIEQFVEDGGRLLLLGEPNRVEISLTILGASVPVRESALTGLGNRFGLSFDTRYVYDLEHHDGNYQRPLVSPTREGSAASVGRNLSTVRTVSLYTATTVRSTGDGVPILGTADTASLAGSDGTGPYPVAVQDGRVLAVGDSTFVGSAYYSVADNEVFIAELVEFLVTGERIYRPIDGGGNGTVSNETTVTAGGTETG